MGQQQLLLIILGVVIVGIAIAVGLQLFQAGSVGANQDAMMNDIMNISATADQWRIRPETMGGGGGSFTTAIQTRLNDNDRLTTTSNAGYVVTVTEDLNGPGTIQIVGTSANGYGDITLKYDPNAAAEADRYEWWGSDEFDHLGDAPTTTTE